MRLHIQRSHKQLLLALSSADEPCAGGNTGEVITSSKSWFPILGGLYTSPPIPPGIQEEWPGIFYQPISTQIHNSWCFPVQEESTWNPGKVPVLTGFCKGYCGRTGAERNAVLAGDPKGIRVWCNTTLITDIPSRGSKEERIRIHLQVWANIRNNGYKR